MKKRKKWIIIIISIICIVLLVGICGMSWYIGNSVFKGSTQLVNNEDTQGVGETFLEQYEIDYDEFKENYNIESIEIVSSLDGHIIPADYIYAQEAQDAQDKNNNTIILVHGLGGNRYSNYPLAKFFLEQGYNVITYDQRSSGENTAQYTTFGYWESQDLKDYVLYANKYAKEKKIGVWGSSFGGATAGTALSYDEVSNILDFAILDCPVSSMEYMIRIELESMDMGIPVDYMLFCGNIINKYRLNFGYEDADVAKNVSETKVPLLIFNSEADTLTPSFMGQDIYNAVPHQNKEIVTVQDSKHADIWLDYNEMYKQKIIEFLDLHSIK